MNWYSSSGRAGLARALMALGYSVRKAERIVNAVIDIMTEALQRGEQVQTPLGTFRVAERKGRRRNKLQRFCNISTGDTQYKFIVFNRRGNHHVVTFTPCEDLNLTPSPAPVPPPQQYDLQCRELATELLGEPVTAAIMAELERSAAFPRPKSGALLRRLQNLKARGHQYEYAPSLAGAIRGLYFC